MRLGWTEKWLINNPLREFVQKVFEGRQLLRLGGTANRARALEIGCGADSIITYHRHKEEADSVVSEIEAKDQRAVALQLDVGDIKSFGGFMRYHHQFDGTRCH